jgi:hypothetical protein
MKRDGQTGKQKGSVNSIYIYQSFLALLYSEFDFYVYFAGVWN